MLRKYEGMFLFDPAVLTDWESVQTELGRLMERVGARVISSTKWDERRLAYEIKGRKRGVYALAYFEADASKIAHLERDVELSEAALRCLVVRVDHMTEEQMKQAGPRPVEEAEPDDYRRDYRRDDRDRHRRSEDENTPSRGRGAGREAARTGTARPHPHRARGDGRPDDEGGADTPIAERPEVAGGAQDGESAEPKE